MPTRQLVFVTVVALVFGAALPVAAGWEEHTRAGEWAFARGDFERAEVELRAALDEAQGFDQGDPRLETSLGNLARLLEHRSREDEAQPLFQLLVAAREARLGEEHPGLLSPLAAVARTSLRIGDTPTAEDALDRYIQLAEQTGKADPSQLWVMLSLRSRTLALAEDGAAALELQRRAVTVLAEDSGADPLAHAAELETLAQLELLYGTAVRAEALLLEAGTLRQEWDETTSPVPTLVAGAETAYGAAEPEVAEALARRALAHDPPPDLRRRALVVIADVAWLEVGRTGADPADVLGTATAEPAVADALEQLTGLAELLDQSPAASRGERLVVLERLAVVAALAGDVDAAVRWQRRLADESPEDRLEPDVALVDLLEAAGRVDEALAANREVVATLEADRREPDPRLLVPLQVQQRLLEAAGERREARRVKKRIRKLERTLR